MIQSLGSLQYDVLPLLAQAGGSFWLPPQDSTTAKVMDPVFYLILTVCAVFFVLVVGFMAFFVIRYRRRPGVQAQKTATSHTLLEVTWTVIPLLIVAYIFYRGFAAYMDMRTSPPGAYEIRVTARKWTWLFTYPNGYVDDNLHVPADEPVKLIMTSEDVIHSLWIPAFRTKMDVVPGRYTTTWFRATRPGEYNLYCTEYCGASADGKTGHFSMFSNVIVHKPGQFEPWLAEAANLLKRMSPKDAGRMLYQRRGCTQCHSVDGTAGTGPSFKGIFGQTRTFTDGSTLVLDDEHFDNYVRQSVLDPQAKIRSGFQPVMPTYKGILKDDEITAIIVYLKSLK